jgi:hypothetical protein
MMRFCERVEWSGGKLDLVWTSLVCIDDSTWFLKALLCCSRLFLLVIFGALSWWFSRCVFGTLLLGIWWGNMWEPFVVLLPLIPLPNSWVKGLNFGVFSVLGLEEFLEGFLRFLLIWQVLVGLNLIMDSSWGVPNIPKVLFKSVEWFGRSRLGFGGVDPRVMFIPRSPGHTGLTGASHRSDRCNLCWVFAWVNIWVCSLLSCVAAVSSLGQFGVR